MNEITIHGNVTADPDLRYPTSSDSAFATFSVAVNRGYYSRTTGRWVEQAPVFHQVIVRRALAENAAVTLRRGMTVTVTGQIADDSYTPTGSDRLIRRQRLDAADIAVSLRWATAEVTRQTGRQALDHQDAPGDDTAAPAGSAGSSSPTGEAVTAGEGDGAAAVEPTH